MPEMHFECTMAELMKRRPLPLESETKPAAHQQKDSSHIRTATILEEVEMFLEVRRERVANPSCTQRSAAHTQGKRDNRGE